MSQLCKDQDHSSSSCDLKVRPCGDCCICVLPPKNDEKLKELSELLRNRPPCKTRPVIFAEKGHRFTEFKNASSMQECSKDESCSCELVLPACPEICLKPCLKNKKLGASNDVKNSKNTKKKSVCLKSNPRGSILMQNSEVPTKSNGDVEQIKSQKDVNINFQVNMQRKKKKMCNCKKTPTVGVSKNKKDKAKPTKCICSQDQESSQQHSTCSQQKAIIICDKAPEPRVIVCKRPNETIKPEKKSSFLQTLLKLINNKIRKDNSQKQYADQNTATKRGPCVCSAESLNNGDQVGDIQPYAQQDLSASSIENADNQNTQLCACPKEDPKLTKICPCYSKQNIPNQCFCLKNNENIVCKCQNEKEFSSTEKVDNVNRQPLCDCPKEKSEEIKQCQYFFKENILSQCLCPKNNENNFCSCQKEKDFFSIPCPFAQYSEKQQKPCDCGKKGDNLQNCCLCSNEEKPYYKDISQKNNMCVCNRKEDQLKVCGLEKRNDKSLSCPCGQYKEGQTNICICSKYVEKPQVCCPKEKPASVIQCPYFQSKENQSGVCNCCKKADRPQVCYTEEKQINMIPCPYAQIQQNKPNVCTCPRADDKPQTCCLIKQPNPCICPIPPCLICAQQKMQQKQNVCPEKQEKTCTCCICLKDKGKPKDLCVCCPRQKPQCICLQNPNNTDNNTCGKKKEIMDSCICSTGEKSIYTCYRSPDQSYCPKKVCFSCPQEEETCPLCCVCCQTDCKPIPRCPFATKQLSDGCKYKSSKPRSKRSKSKVSRTSNLSGPGVTDTKSNDQSKSNTGKSVSKCIDSKNKKSGSLTREKSYRSVGSNDNYASCECSEKESKRKSTSERKIDGSVNNGSKRASMENGPENDLKNKTKEKSQSNSGTKQKTNLKGKNTSSKLKADSRVEDPKSSLTIIYDEEKEAFKSQEITPKVTEFMFIRHTVPLAMLKRRFWNAPFSKSLKLDILCRKSKKFISSSITRRRCQPSMYSTYFLQSVVTYFMAVFVLSHNRNNYLMVIVNYFNLNSVGILYCLSVVFCLAV